MFFLLLLPSLILTSMASRCPGPEYIFPCSCIESSSNYITTPITFCERFQELGSFLKVIERSTDHPLVRLVLRNSAFNYLPAVVLREKSVRELAYETVYFVGMFDRVPEVNRKLKVVEMTESRFLRGVEWEMFKNFHNLTTIRITSVQIRKLGKEFLDSVQPSLETLVLKNTNVSTLHDHVFSRLTNIISLHVVRGRIKELKRSMFPVENVIRVLGFPENQISFIPDDLFSNMPKLESVSLDVNHITIISETVFGNFKERDIELSFSYNKLECNCKTRWLLQKKWKPLAECHSPPHFRGKNLRKSQLTDDDLEYCDDV